MSEVQKVVALLGNPNCGKSTLFNALTGASQRVGNWPGVTVERKSGHLTLHNNQQIELIDLPGVYALFAKQETLALDERITTDFVAKKEANIIINVVDGTQLERQLYLTLQLIELNIPFILVLNMMDIAARKGINIDSSALAKQLDCSVIALSAKDLTGVKTLKERLTGDVLPSSVQIPYPQSVKEAIAKSPAQTPQEALRDLEINPQCLGDEDSDILIADSRFRFIQMLLKQCVTKKQPHPVSGWTEKIDHLVLNRLLGLPIFLCIMYLLFVFAINVGGVFQDFIDILTQAFFVDGFAALLLKLHAPNWVIAIFAHGLGKGINTTLTFTPVIAAMYFFLAVLEDVGYMARVAFVVDKLMRFLGLPGKAFIPMMVGFGCNVPAIMGARTLHHQNDRILTIMMAPFMSCSARLAIFAVFVSAFFKQGGQNIIFVLYLTGIAMAVSTGFILRKTLIAGDPTPLIMELPAYHRPDFFALLRLTWQRLKGFLVRAGRLIVPICMLIGALNTLNIDGSLGEGDAQSLLAYLGMKLTPLFTPMGIHADNWPATVGLMTGVLAKEVVVGTLNTLYTQLGHLAVPTVLHFNAWASIKAAFFSIGDNIRHLGEAFLNPILAGAPIDEVHHEVYGVMYQHFDGKVGAFAYLLFILLYFPCVSTLAAMLKELHRGWSFFAAAWMTLVAYGTAVFFYQSATFNAHPQASLMWMLGIVAAFLGTFFFMRLLANRDQILTRPLS